MKASDQIKTAAGIAIASGNLGLSERIELILEELHNEGKIHLHDDFTTGGSRIRSYGLEPKKPYVPVAPKRWEESRLGPDKLSRAEQEEMLEAHGVNLEVYNDPTLANAFLASTSLKITTWGVDRSRQAEAWNVVRLLVRLSGLDDQLDRTKKY